MVQEAAEGQHPGSESLTPLPSGWVTLPQPTAPAEGQPCFPEGWQGYRAVPLCSTSVSEGLGCSLLPFDFMEMRNNISARANEIAFLYLAGALSRLTREEHHKQQPEYNSPPDSGVQQQSHPQPLCPSAFHFICISFSGAAQLNV